MTNSFTRQLEPCSRTGPFAYPGPGVNRDFSPLTSDANSSGTAAELIPSRPKEGAFLKRFLAGQGGAESLRLQERLTRADCESKSILRALFWFGSLFVLSLVAVSYCAVLLPDFFSYRPQMISTSLIILCFVSLSSEAELLGELLWHRISVNRLHQECRRLMLSLIGPQFTAPQTESSMQPSARKLLLFPPSN